MPKYEFCIPTVGKVVPAGADWFHEIKYDGYRVRVERDGDRVQADHRERKRLDQAVPVDRRGGASETVASNSSSMARPSSWVSTASLTFNALHSGKQNGQVQFCAFDVLAVDGADVRDLPLSMRKANLDRLLRGRPDGIFINPFEIGAIGPDLFRAACVMGLEGLVSKRSDRPYRGGRSPHWVKVKNRRHPAMMRVMEAFR